MFQPKVHLHPLRRIFRWLFAPFFFHATVELFTTRESLENQNNMDYHESFSSICMTWNSYLRAISPFLRWCRMSTIVWLPVNPPEWVEQGLKSEYPRRRVAVFSPQAGDPQSIMSWYFQHQSATSVVTQTRTSTLVGDSTKRVLIWLRLGHRLQLLCYSQPKTVVEIKSSSGGQLLKKMVIKKVLIFIHRGLKTCKSRKDSSCCRFCRLYVVSQLNF